MKASVIIPTFNGADRIRPTLDALTKQTESDFELIVVNDGSTDKTPDVLRSFSDKFLKLITVTQPNGGRACARNAGVKNCSENLLIFLDDDIIPINTFIKNHLDHHKTHNDSIIVGSQIENLTLSQGDFEDFKSGLSRKWMRTLGKEKTILSKPFITAANFSMPRSLFKRLEGFDTRLTDAEDYELALRSFANQIPIYFDPDIIGWHNDHITCYSYILRQRQYASSIEKVRKIHDLPKKKIKNRKIKSLFYGLVSHNILVKSIDNNKLTWMSKKIRYKIYDWVVTGLGTYFPERKLK